MTGAYGQALRTTTDALPSLPIAAVPRDFEPRLKLTVPETVPALPVEEVTPIGTATAWPNTEGAGELLNDVFDGPIGVTAVDAPDSSSVPRCCRHER